MTRRCASLGPRIHIARGVTDHEQEPRAEGLTRSMPRGASWRLCPGSTMHMPRNPACLPTHYFYQRKQRAVRSHHFTADDPLEAVCAQTRTVPAVTSRTHHRTQCWCWQTAAVPICRASSGLQVSSLQPVNGAGPRSTSGSGVACASQRSARTPPTALPGHLCQAGCGYTSAEVSSPLCILGSSNRSGRDTVSGCLHDEKMKGKKVTPSGG